MWKARIAALCIGALYVAGAVRLDIDASDNYGYFAFAFVALCLIWFPEQLGSVRGVGLGGTSGIASVDQETPGCVVGAFGWLMLIGVPIAWWAMRDVTVS